MNEIQYTARACRGLDFRHAQILVECRDVVGFGATPAASEEAFIAEAVGRFRELLLVRRDSGSLCETSAVIMGVQVPLRDFGVGLVPSSLPEEGHVFIVLGSYQYDDDGYYQPIQNRYFAVPKGSRLLSLSEEGACALGGNSLCVRGNRSLCVALCADYPGHRGHNLEFPPGAYEYRRGQWVLSLISLEV